MMIRFLSWLECLEIHFFDKRRRPNVLRLSPPLSLKTWCLLDTLFLRACIIILTTAMAERGLKDRLKLRGNVNERSLCHLLSKLTR